MLWPLRWCCIAISNAFCGGGGRLRGQGEVAQVLYHQHQRLAAAWQLFGCHVSGKLSWSVWEQLFAVLKPHYRPEKVPSPPTRRLIVAASQPRPLPTGDPTKINIPW